VDLNTLSELTKSVGVASEGSEGTRSKRTCVRVRQEISKLQEILGEDGMEVKPLGKSGGRCRRSGGGATPARPSLGTSRPAAEVDEEEGMSGGSGLLPPAKKKRSSYSQFTHKRRKRKKKQPDDGELIGISKELALTLYFQYY